MFENGEKRRKDDIYGLLHAEKVLAMFPQSTLIRIQGAAWSDYLVTKWIQTSKNALEKNRYFSSQCFFCLQCVSY